MEDKEKGERARRVRGGWSVSVVAMTACREKVSKVKRELLTPSHIFGLLYELEPDADLTARQPLLAARVPILHGLVVVDGEVVLGGLLLQRPGHRRPRALRDDGEFVPAIMEQQRDHRLGHLRVRRLGPRERVHLRRFVVRAFLQSTHGFPIAFSHRSSAQLRGCSRWPR